MDVDGLRRKYPREKREVSDRSSCDHYFLLAYIALTLYDDFEDEQYLDDALTYLDAAEIAGCM